MRMIGTSQKEKKEYSSSELKNSHIQEKERERERERESATNEEQIQNDTKISRTRTRQRDQHVQPRFFVDKHPVDAIHERFGFHVVKEPRDATFAARVGVILGVVILSL